jgi:hypothetical protein
VLDRDEDDCPLVAFLEQRGRLTGTESMPENNLDRSSTGGLDEDGVLGAKARCCAEG